MQFLISIVCLLGLSTPIQAGRGLRATFSVPREHFFKNVCVINQGTETSVYIATLITDYSVTAYDDEKDDNNYSDKDTNVVFKAANDERGNQLQKNEAAAISFLQRENFSPLPNILFTTLDKNNYFRNGANKMLVGMNQLGADFVDFIGEEKYKIHGKQGRQPEISKMLPIQDPKEGAIVPGGIPLYLLMPYIEQLLATLDRLQKLRVVHRDVKTDNLMFLMETPTILVLADFAYADGKFATLPDRDEPKGTLGYMRMNILEEVIKADETTENSTEVVPRKKFIAIPEDDAAGAGWSIADWIFGVPWLERVEVDEDDTSALSEKEDTPPLSRNKILQMQKEYLQMLAALIERSTGTPCAALAQIVLDLLTLSQRNDVVVPSNWDFPYQKFIKRFQEILTMDGVVQGFKDTTLS